MTDIFLQSNPASFFAPLLTARSVVDGEQVTAAVTNRLPEANQQNTLLLHEILKRINTASGEFLWNVPVSPEVESGDFVAYDTSRRVFVPGLAKFLFEAGRRLESPLAHVWGVVIRAKDKEADICVSGLCTFETDRSCWLEFPEPGIRFLSNTRLGEPEVLSHFPDKCLGFLVGVKAKGTGAEVQFFVKQYLAMNTRIHQHTSVQLKNELVNAATSERWLPATHSVFAGKVPAGGAV